MTEPETKWVYYARPQSLYNTPAEFRDLELLSSLGYTCIEFTDLMQERAKTEGMKPFLERITSSELLAFRAFPCGRIGAGVWKEIETAQLYNIPVLELPQLNSDRAMTVAQTRWYLAAMGQR